MADIEPLPAKTTRFTRIVEAAGHPEPYTLWQAPEKDAEFQKALRAHRVMTVLRQPASSKSDVAVAGFLARPGALYLLFPRSLEQFENHRVIGLKYDLLTQPTLKGKPVTAADLKPRRPATPAPSIAPQPSIPGPAPRVAHAIVEKKPLPPPRFTVTATITSTVERTLEVEAKNQSEARKLALGQLKSEPLDFEPREKAVKITKISRLE